MGHFFWPACKLPTPVIALRPIRIPLSHADDTSSIIVKAQFWACVVALCVLTACGKSPRVMTPTTVSDQGAQRGLASWYGMGDGYHGNTTASGERFDRSQLTAAHYDLPFGTRVKVTNLRNGRHVVVRINDRFSLETLQKGRIVDLSYRAAQLLDMVRDGVVPVLLEVLPQGGD